jgi:hypothetical protein
MAVVAIAVIAFLTFQFNVVRRPQTGFGPTAERLAKVSSPSVILVSADAPREGMAVAEIAMRDLRPRHYVLRGSKVLASSDWFGKSYRPLFQTPQQMAAYLDSVPVDFILVDDSRPAPLPHMALLSQFLHENSATWRRVAAPGPMALWERLHPVAHGEPKITVDMKNTLGTISSGSASSDR